MASFYVPRSFETGNRRFFLNEELIATVIQYILIPI